MRVECFNRVDDTEAAKVYESDVVTTKTVTAERHEVIVTVDDKELGKTVEKLLEVYGEDRDNTSPERYARIDIYDGDELVNRLDVVGSGFEAPVKVEPPLSDDEMRALLKDRNVKYPKNAKSDQLMQLVLDNGGLPEAEQAPAGDEQAQQEQQ